jgi:hypothetical protein
MLRAVTFVLIIFGALTIVALVIFVINRRRQPDFGTVAPEGRTDDLQSASHQISVLSWNIGYGALGQQADFYMDNGRSIRALSRDDIQVVANRIAHTLSNGKWNVICIQENASASFLTRGVAVRQIIDLALSALRHFHWADLKAVFMPSGLKFDHGMSTYTAIQDMGCEIIKLPQGTSYFLGFLKKYYVGQLSRYAIGETGKDWVIINTHLSAYDEGGIV